MAEKQHWVPLESNPDVLNKYIHNLGVPNMMFVDVYGLDMELLQTVPRPVYAVVMLFPVTEKAKASPIGTVQTDAQGLYFIKQAIGNACGTIAIIHALANSEEEKFEAGKPMMSFLEKTRKMTPEERADHLAKDENMGVAHEDSAQEGQTQAPSADEKVNTHFITFVHHEGGLYELNGNREGPVKHGDTETDQLLEKAVVVVKKFMERDPEEINFTVMALVKKE